MAATSAIVTASLFPKATAAKLLAVRSSVVPPPQPPRLTRRRNYLRRKLLKTLRKPSPDTPALILTPAEGLKIGVQEFKFESPPEPKARDFENPAAKPGFDAAEEFEASSSDAKGSDFAEASLSESSSVLEASPSGLGRVSARTVVRFGACFVGVLILQAIVRALVVDSDSGDDKSRRRRTDMKEVGINGNGSSFREKLEMKNRALLYVNEAELEAKIAEIRMMAMEAKEHERNNSRDGNLGSDDKDDDSDDEVEDDRSVAKSGIEREIDGRLTRVKRSLDTVRENSEVMNVNFLNKPKQVDAEKGKKNGFGEREKDKTLMFEKKYIFRSGDTSKPRDKPKGFHGSDRIGRNGSVKGSGLSNKALRVDMESNSDLKREVKRISDVDDVKKTTEASSQFHAPKKELGDKSIGMNLKKEIEENVEQQKDEGGKTKTSRKPALPQSEGRWSRGKRVGSIPSTSKGDSKEIDASAELWWLNLPYLLAIAMRQGYEEEKEGGFYSLKTTSTSDEPSQTQTSYTVLFEDRGDAQNFCFLLESFFEELEDMSFFVIPLPIKELNDAVKSQAKKVIVVRKGQLQLYAGQPLHEVETVLRSLLK